jgi:hypothetical protein
MSEKQPKKITDPSGGANQSRVRDYNERLVLSLVRRHGSLAKSQIARRSGLSAQTVSVIMRSLEHDGLLLKGEPLRGKVGQPSIPMSLNSNGVFSIGLKIGRRSADLVLASITNLPVRIQNDATAACGAELVFGRGKELTDFVYFFIGTFIGGGIVLNHGLYSGRTGNAGGFGPMPVMQPDGKITTLIDHASIYTLEMRLKAEGFDLSHQWHESENWHLPTSLIDEWIDDTARHLAWAIVASCSVIDFQAAVVDGALPTDIRQRIVESIRVEVGKLDTRGISDLTILEGVVGRGARALGGASLPFFSLYLLDQNVLFKGIES